MVGQTQLLVEQKRDTKFHTPFVLEESSILNRIFSKKWVSSDVRRQAVLIVYHDVVTLSK